jgi:MarR family 2-MHQ and catechol resistance regulon transcriptional repressor
MFGVADPALRDAVRAYVKLMRATRAVQARVEPMLAREGLTLTQLGVLEAILHKGPLTQRELGRKVLTSPGNMTDVIDKLERRGLVCRSREGADRRQVQVSLTEAGAALIRRIFPAHAADIGAAMAGLDHASIAQLDGLLRRLGMVAAQPLPCVDVPAA